MPTFMISFPKNAMPTDDVAAASIDFHAVVADAKASGVWLCGGALSHDTPPILVEADGAITRGNYPETEHIEGGFALLSLPSFDEAVSWAARFAAACRCAQEVRVFAEDPHASTGAG